MTFNFFHFTTHAHLVIEAETEEMAWGKLQDREELGLDELRDSWECYPSSPVDFQ
ncbi:MAG: hypothetical protein MN733_22220 [Nitrososphaera sp.]|nr:hypothetical protein [Nitrososphaera sp.]